MQSITCQILTQGGPTMKQLASLYLSYFLDHRKSPYLVTILIFRERKGSLRFFLSRDHYLRGPLCSHTLAKPSFSSFPFSAPSSSFFFSLLFSIWKYIVVNTSVCSQALHLVWRDRTGPFNIEGGRGYRPEVFRETNDATGWMMGI